MGPHRGLGSERTDAIPPGAGVPTVSQLRETGEGGSFEGTSGGGVPLLLPPRLTTGTVWDRDGSVEIVEGTLDKVQESGSNSVWLPTTHYWRGPPGTGEVPSCWRGSLHQTRGWRDVRDAPRITHQSDPTHREPDSLLHILILNQYLSNVSI